MKEQFKLIKIHAKFWHLESEKMSTTEQMKELAVSSTHTRFWDRHVPARCDTSEAKLQIWLGAYKTPANKVLLYKIKRVHYVNH